MTSFKKEIKINPIPTSSELIVLNIPIHLSTNTINTNGNFQPFSSQTYKIKIDDIIPVSVSIENTSNFSSPSLTLEIISDENFFFIPGSLMNSSTKEAYCPNEINSSIFHFNSLKPFEKFEIIFFVKAKLLKLKEDPTSNPLIFLPCSNNSNYITDISTPFLIAISQAILEINSNSKDGTITIKNSGLDSAKKLYLKYITPKGFKSDISSVKAKLNNSPFEISSFKINNDILFLINFIPQRTNNIPTILNISFDSHDLNALHSFSMSIV